jgi:hypothetical protein
LRFINSDGNVRANLVAEFAGIALIRIIVAGYPDSAQILFFRQMDILLGTRIDTQAATFAPIGVDNDFSF